MAEGGGTNRKSLSQSTSALDVKENGDEDEENISRLRTRSTHIVKAAPFSYIGTTEEESTTTPQHLKAIAVESNEKKKKKYAAPSVPFNYTKPSNSQDTGQAVGDAVTATAAVVVVATSQQVNSATNNGNDVNPKSEAPQQRADPVTDRPSPPPNINTASTSPETTSQNPDTTTPQIPSEPPPPYPGPPLAGQPPYPGNPTFSSDPFQTQNIGFGPDTTPQRAPTQASSSAVVYSSQPTPSARIIKVGECPSCHVGTMVSEFSGLGILVAVCFFPCGILCCLMMRQKRCTHCQMTFGGG